MEKEKRTATIKTKINKYYPANVNEKRKKIAATTTYT